ncbi:MAG TPA: GNAT family N-acetyltransferase [Thermoplasmata archaeon]|nr:GNAT family N-acetyltransferase [Thermoplasmata archaeon]
MDRGSERTASSAEKPSGALLVERVTHQDVVAICTLYKKVWDPAPSGVPIELVKALQPTALEFTSWMGGVTYFAARQDGRLVGVVGCEFYHGNCRLVHLAVDPETRRHGVATALVGAASEWAKKANAGSVWVDALDALSAATALFSKLGFARVGTLHQHEWGKDVTLFERVL